jgi:hypothetical protein
VEPLESTESGISSGGKLRIVWYGVVPKAQPAESIIGRIKSSATFRPIVSSSVREIAVVIEPIVLNGEALIL